MPRTPRSSSNGAFCAPSDQKFGEERDIADPGKGIATYVGGGMYVGKKPSTGVDAECNITLSSSNAPDGSYAAEAEGLTVINSKLASQVQQCGQELAAHR